MIAGIFLLSIFTLFIIIAIPATMSLGRVRRDGVTKLNIDAAAEQLKATGKNGWELVAYITLFVHDRLQYCRRNSFDSYTKAFERGYGYCQQQAYALQHILQTSGFEARVVHSFRNKLPDGRIVSHAWVEVTYHNEKRYYCSVFPDKETGQPTFEILGRVYYYNALFRLLAGWGAIGVNAMRYYTSGDGL